MLSTISRVTSARTCIFCSKVILQKPSHPQYFLPTSTLFLRRPISTKIHLFNSEIRLRLQPVIVVYRFYSKRPFPTEAEPDYRNVIYWCLALLVSMLGVAVAAVPLYRYFCEATAFEGKAKIVKDLEKIAKLEKNKHRLIKVIFDATVPAKMANIWNFKPQQREIHVSFVLGLRAGQA